MFEKGGRFLENKEVFQSLQHPQGGGGREGESRRGLKGESPETNMGAAAGPSAVAKGIQGGKLGKGIGGRGRATNKRSLKITMGRG